MKKSSSLSSFSQALFFALVIILGCFQSTISKAQQSIFDTSSASLFSNDDEFLKVDQAFIFNFDQAKNQLNINFEINEGYYLYRHQFKFTSDNARISPVDLPPGIDHEDEFFGVQQIYTKNLNFTINIEEASENDVITVRYQGCADKGLCYPPTKKKISLTQVITQVNENNSAGAILSALQNEQNVSTTSKTTAPQASEQHQLAEMLKQDSLLLTLIAFFMGGLLLSFTPCVFPMY